jgi:glycosyltransferase involved in cell wall biosynthesis
MKILHVITNLGMGGAETVFYHRMLYYFERGEADQHLIYYLYDGFYVEKLRSRGFTVTKITGLLHPCDPVGLYRFFSLVKKENPLCIDASLWLAQIMARLIGALLQIPVICQMHSDLRHHGVMRNLIDAIVPHKHATFVAVTSLLLPLVKKKFSSASTILIHNGVDFKKIRAGDAEKTSWYDKKKEDLLIIGVSGRLVSLKQYDVFLKAIALLASMTEKKMHALVIGDGPEKQNLIELAHALKIEDRVSFVGMQENVFDWYDLIDVLVSCSRTEAFSMVILEAMAAGKVVVATESTNAREMISHYQNGILLPQADPKQIAFALLTLIQNDALRKKVGVAAQELVLNNFDMSIIEQRYMQLYRSFFRKN